MFDLHTSLAGLVTMLALGFATWLVSLVKRDVSIVDSVWSLLFVAGAFAYWAVLPETGPRTIWIMAMLLLWAARLAGYITWRNWGETEDARYQAIRARNQPHFALKSLALVFMLQGVLAWIVSLPLLAALASTTVPGWMDALGFALFALGLVFETIADAQLARFKRRAEGRGKVMDSGLWRYSRHPNYFGEFCVWWGFYLVAVAAGGWWALPAPLLMSLLLLRVSGVALLEKDIVERRPAYRDYIARTHAFFPWWPKP